jgi:hypothetical protein
MVSPLSVPDMIISTVLEDISKVSEAEASHLAEPVEMGLHAKPSTGMFLCVL